MLALRSFVVIKLPQDGILVPKHVAVGIQYEVFLIYFIVIGAFRLLKHRNIK